MSKEHLKWGLLLVGIAGNYMVRDQQSICVDLLLGIVYLGNGGNEINRKLGSYWYQAQHGQ